MKITEKSNVFFLFLQGFVGYPLAILCAKYWIFNGKKKIPMFSLDFCSVLLGYPLAILCEKMVQFSMKNTELSNVSPYFYRVL